MNVQIGEDYRLTTKPGESYITIERRKIVDPLSSPMARKADYDGPTEPYEKWTDWKFPQSLEQALDILAKQNLYDSDATSLDELASEMQRFRRSMVEAIKGEGMSLDELKR